MKAREDEPAALVGYVTKIAFRATSEALSALVRVNRLDLPIEYLVADEGKVLCAAVYCRGPRRRAGQARRLVEVGRRARPRAG